MPKDSVNDKPLLRTAAREGTLIALVTLCAYLTLSLATYSEFDPGWSKTGDGSVIDNAAGPTGAYIADVFFTLFGYVAYLFPLMLAQQIWSQLKERADWTLDPLVFVVRGTGFVLVVASACGLVVLRYGESVQNLPFSSGGY